MAPSMAKVKEKHLQKITINLPSSLVGKAIKNTGLGITETLKQGLELINASAFYEEALSKKGKIKFSLSTKALRQD